MISGAGEQGPLPEEDLDDLYENAPCGYLSIRPDGRIFKVNATLADWSGFRQSEIVGKRLFDLLTVGSRIFYETHHAPLLAFQGYFEEASLDFKTAQGDKLPVFANAAERRDADGNLLFTRLTIFKAAERRRYERELIEAREAAEAARQRSEALEAVTQQLLKVERDTSQLREQFIAVMGHDLRNPLASITAGTRLLLIEPQSERRKRLILMVQGSVARMSALIDNVLDLARGRLGGGLTIALSEVALGPVLQQVIDELRVGVPDHEIRTELSLSAAVTCDHARIAQMVSNLVGNALTHGASNQPVRVHASTDTDELVIWVANGGKPIPPAAMERLFQPFFRGEVKASQQGLGLGLYIVSEIARAHGGTLTVESSEEETRFTFRMRRTPAPQG